MKYVTKVVKTDENGTLTILFPKKLLEALNLKENEVLQWEVSPDAQQVYITKTGLIYTSSESEQQ